jgi:glycosyltransferase involved in cell wall biosynthesis
MRVLLTATAGVDQRLDGLTVFSDSLARHLAEKDNTEVALLVSDIQRHPVQPQLQEIEIGGLRVFRMALPAPDSVKESLTPSGFSPLFRETLQAFQADVIHFNNLELLSAEMIAIAEELGLAAVLTLHDFFLICPAVRLVELNGSICPGPKQGQRCGSCLAATGHLAGRYKSPWRWLARRWDVKVRHVFRKAFPGRFEKLHELVNKLNAIVTPSNYVGELMKNAGMLNEYLVIPDGSEISLLPATVPEKAPVLVMLAHHSRTKGTHLLVEALQTLPDLKVRVGIHGNGAQKYLKRLKRICRQDSRIEFMGGFLPTDVEKILTECDAVVVPSIFPETYSISAHDALAAGRPSIVPSDCGAEEVVAGEKYGLCFERGSVKSLAKSLAKLLGDRALLADISNKIRKDRPLVTRNEVTDKYLALYNDVVARKTN